MARLRRVDCSSPGFTRRRRGNGFSYLDERGKTIRDPAAVERIRALAIPPAWADVWICPDENGHLQAVGTDAAGRRQYLYHPRWRTRRDSQKFDAMLEFAGELPSVRRRVSRLLGGEGLTHDRVLACAVGLLDRGLFRVGGDEYADENGSYGLATLERRHVRLPREGVLEFDYEGKAGKRQLIEVADRRLFQVGSALKRVRRRDPRFLAFRNGRGFVDVHSDDINAFVKELAGDAYSAKDFRTWHATVLAAADLAGSGKPASESAARREVAQTVERVAEHLGNTPAVCRASYIDPRVFERYRAGRTIEPASSARSAIEAAVLELI